MDDFNFPGARFMCDPLYKEPNRHGLTDENLLALGYYKQWHREVFVLGKSKMSSFDGRHRCLAQGDKVLMTDGSWRNIEDIKEGDLVFSPQHNGQVITSKVIQTHKHFEENVYDIVDAKFGNRRIYSCSKDHKIPIIEFHTKGYKEYQADELVGLREKCYTIKMEFNTDKIHINRPTHVQINCFPSSPQMVYGFTLDSPSGLFITNDWLVTHNSGKSIASAVSGYLLDKTFFKRMEYRIVQDHHDFMDELEHVKKENIKGAYLQVDEAGVSMSSDDWYEGWMKTLSKTMQMFGYLCPQISFTTPVQDFVSSKLRKMLHAYHSVSRGSNEYATIIPYKLKYSTLRKKMMNPHPVIKLFDMRVKLKSFRLPKPPPKLLDRYEEIANPSKDKMLDNFIADSKSARAEREQDAVDVEAAALQVFENKDLFGFKGRKGKITFDEAMIETKFTVKPKIAKLIKRLAERLHRREQAEIEEALNDGKAPKVKKNPSEWL